MHDEERLFSERRNDIGRRYCICCRNTRGDISAEYLCDRIAYRVASDGLCADNEMRGDIVKVVIYQPGRIWATILKKVFKI